MINTNLTIGRDDNYFDVFILDKLLTPLNGLNVDDVAALVSKAKPSLTWVALIPQASYNISFHA